MSQGAKKGKKNKGTVISLQSFLANNDRAASQLTKKVVNFGDPEADEKFVAQQQVYELPTAPKANRLLDEDSVPHKPPFVAYVNNLPFDANQADIQDFFKSVELVSIRLPKEDGAAGRSRGFCYIELKNRDDLLKVLSLPDPAIKGRRIRIEISNESEQSQSNNKFGHRRYDGFSSGNSERDRESGNWRKDNQYENSTYGKGGEKTFNKERIAPLEGNNLNSSWRNNKSATQDAGGNSAPNESRYNRSYNREKQDFDGYNTERPKLNLMPRTLPLPEQVLASTPEESTAKTSSKKVLAENLFGAAKPVDTRERDVQIEERLYGLRQVEKPTVDNQQKIDLKNANSNWRKKEQSEMNSKKDEEKRNEWKSANAGSNNNSEKQGAIKQKTVSKETKREPWTERSNSKQVQQQPEIHQNSNKYSGLDEFSD